MSSRSADKPASAVKGIDIRSLVTQNRVDLAQYEDVYKELHREPELSGLETKTASYIVKHLKTIGVTELFTDVGGHGIAGVLRNGSGSTVLLRADFDALPLEEKTGLPYASQTRQVDTDGKEKPAMHACGHDMHVACLLAALETLMKLQESWAGTIIFVFQPSEEPLTGARAMIQDGLFEKVPVPDYVLGQHVLFDRSGSVGTREGAFMASSDSLKITFYGRGSHASFPHKSVDPIIMASSAVLRLQTIISREVAASDTAVLTVSAFHGGSAQNVIESEAFILVNIRTFDEELRTQILAAIERIVKAEAKASGATKEPEIECTHKGPTLVNDPTATKELSKAFAEYFGDSFNPERKAEMGTEDFGELATAIGKPSVFWFFGGTDQKLYDDAKQRGKLLEEVPMNHSPLYAPVIRPTLETGVDAMVTAALTFVGKQQSA